jgi:hypothetical protein
MRTLFIACLLGLGLHGQAQAAAEMDSTGAFQAVFEVRPSSEQVYQLGWIKQGLAKQEAGRISTLIKLDCLEELDEDMQLTRHQASTEGTNFHCSYAASAQGSPVDMGLERTCRLVFNSLFFELICKEDYFGGAHPDYGTNYYYLDKKAEPVSGEQLAALLAAAKPDDADLKRKATAMKKSCNDWFATHGDRLSRDDLETMVGGSPSPLRAGVDQSGAPLLGMAYYLVRAARGNPCDQKTFWVKVKDAKVWEPLIIKGKVQRLQ